MFEYYSEYGSHCFLGSMVKLIPTGKFYTVSSIGGAFKKFSKSIILTDSKGKEKQIAWDKKVYVPNE